MLKSLILQFLKEIMMPKYGKHRSYKIESDDFNDAMIAKTVKLEKISLIR